MTVRQSSSRYSSGRRRMLVPALFTRMSSPPRRVAVASTMAATAASSVMSATTESAFAAPSAESSSTAAAFFPASRPATITAAPHRARPRASPSPMPPLPPVTSATRPDRSNMLAHAAALLPLDEVGEPTEQVSTVGRPRRGLRVVLHGKGRPVGAGDALVRAVEQRGVRHLARRPAGVLSSTAKPWFWLVISTRPVARSFTGWFAPRWPHLELVGLRPERQRQQLVAEADAEHRHALLQHARGSPAPRIRPSPPGRPARWRGTRRPARAAGSPRRSPSPAPPSPPCRRRRGSAGCCASPRSPPPPRAAAARPASRSRAPRPRSVSSQR